MGLTEQFRSVVRAIVGLPADPGQPPDLIRLGRYRCTVSAQNSDGTVDLTPDDTRISAEKNVIVHVSPPGASWQVQPGAIAWIGWTGGDPSKPYCTPDYESGAVVTKLVLKATMVYLGDEAGAEPLVRKSDFVGHTHAAGTLLDGNSLAVTGATAGAATIPGTSNVKGK